MATAAYSSGFPSQESYNPRRVFVNSTYTPSIKNSDDVSIVISAITNNTSGTFVADIKGIKVEGFNSAAAETLDAYVSTSFGTIYESRPPNAQTLSLTSSIDSIVELWVF
jgi:hypothetical protein